MNAAGSMTGIGKHVARIGGLVAVVAVLAGCMEQEVAVNVSPDGTGTVTVTQLPRMIKAEGGKTALTPLDVSTVAVWATAFNESVTLVSATTFADGKGTAIRAVFSFSDINKLEVPTTAIIPNVKGPRITFKMVPAGAGVRLIATMPKSPEPKPGAPKPKTDPKEAEKVLNQIRDVAGTFKMSVVVTPSRPIKKTSARFRKGSTVTLLQLDWGQLLKKKDILDGQAGGVLLDRKADELNKLPGCTVATGDVTIEF
jgi:hypothetical protein